MSLISTLCLTLVSFANENVNESDYKSYIYSKVENVLNIPKSEIVKDNKSIKRINSYVENSIDLGISLDEFKMNVDKELSEFKKVSTKSPLVKFLVVISLFLLVLVVGYAVLMTISVFLLMILYIFKMIKR